MEREDQVEALALRRARGVGDRLFRGLVEAFGSPAAARRASGAQLSELVGMSPRLAAAVRSDTDLEWASREAAAVAERGFSLLVFGGEGYPERLAEIPDPPAVLYAAGALCPEDRVAVAVVGSRKASTYGLRFAEKLAADLARVGVTVVSGLAQGIDAAAHRGALDGGGRTLAVFGAGLDVVYPSWNDRLALDVRGNGAWLSELPLGSEPAAHHFPRRNRVISGLSLGVVVVEAAERSGTLITAEAALDQGREVFAVPGLPGSYNSRGTHRLLRSGAKLVESADDVLEELSFGGPAPRGGREEAPGRRLPAGLERAWRALEDSPVHIDDVAARAGLSAAQVAADLMELCLLGAAEEWPGKRYTRREADAEAAAENVRRASKAPAWEKR